MEQFAPWISFLGGENRGWFSKEERFDVLVENESLN
jgi:hypothetical protein